MFDRYNQNGTSSYVEDSLKITPHALRFTHMNQTDQFNVKCGDQTPNFLTSRLTFTNLFIA